MNIGNGNFPAIPGGSGPLLAALLALGGGLGNAVAQELVPMELYYSSSRGDNFTATSAEEARNAENAGYYRARTQGYLLRRSRPGAVPMYLYWHGGRGDNFSAVTTSGRLAAQSAGYRYAGIQGYVYNSKQPGTVPMKLWWNGSRADNFSTVTSAGEQAARNAGYRYVRTQGYVYPTSHPQNCLNHSKSLAEFGDPGTVFDDSATLNWNIPVRQGCEDLELVLSSNPSKLFDRWRPRVAPVGSQAVLPADTTTYHLRGYILGRSATIAQRTLLRVDMVTYPEAEDRFGSRDRAEAFLRMILDNVNEYNRRNLLDLTVEFHIIPASLNLTDLPRFEHLAGDPTDRDGDNRTIDNIRGAGGVRHAEEPIIYMAVAEEHIQATASKPVAEEIGFVLFHETGHTVMGQHGDANPRDWFMLHGWQGRDLLDLYDARKADPNFDWPGDEGYVSSSVEEYFAESVAAYFGYAWDPNNNSGEHTPQQLKTNDPAMYDLLDLVFGCDQAIRDGNPPTPADPVCERP